MEKENEIKEEVLRLQEEYERLNSNPIKTKEDIARIREIIKEQARLIKKDLNPNGDIDYDELLKEKEIKEEELNKLEESVVVDNSVIEKKKKELEQVEKALLEKEALNNKEFKEDKEENKEEHKQEEKDEQVKDEKSLNKEEKNNIKEEALKKAYYDAIVAFYAEREKNARSLNKENKLVCTDEEYLSEIRLENDMYKAREEYLELGKPDPYMEERTTLREQEKMLRRENLRLLSEKTREYREIEKEIASLQKEIAEKKNEKDIAVRDGADQKVIDDIDKEILEKESKLSKRKGEAILVKQNLTKAMDILERRNNRRRELNLETREYNSQTKEEKANIKYNKKIQDEMTNNYRQADKLEHENVKSEVERNEARIKELKKELKRLKEEEPDNFEARLNVLEELNEVTIKLEASRESKSDLDNGIELETEQALKNENEKEKTKEQRKEDFKKQADKLITAAKEQEKEEQEISIMTNTELIDEKEKENLMYFETCFIPELRDSQKYNSLNTVEEGKKYIKLVDNKDKSKEEIKEKADTQAEKIENDMQKA